MKSNHSFFIPLYTLLLANRLICAGLVLLPLALLLPALCHTSPLSCSLFRLTGIMCPGCGMTRATIALCQGRLQDSLLLHPLSPPLCLGWLIAALSLCLQRKQRDSLLVQTEKIEKKTGIALFIIVLFLLYGIIRLIIQGYCKIGLS